MQRFRFDEAVFETRFKPWLLRELERHADRVIDDLVREFRMRLRQIALEAKADITINVNDAKAENFAKEITITFSPDFSED